MRDSAWVGGVIDGTARGALVLLVLPLVLVYAAAGLVAGLVACIFFAVSPPGRRPEKS